MNYDFEEFRVDCNEFNRIAGKDSKLSIKDFKDQLKLIQSELKELEEGINNNDIEEILDGFLDVFVTNAGIGQKLEKLGVNVYKAASLVAENNFSKFIEEDDWQELSKTLKKYTEDGVPVYSVLDQESGRWVVKRVSDDKVIKPYSFVSVGLKGTIPKDLLANGIPKSFKE